MSVQNYVNQYMEDGPEKEYILNWFDHASKYPLAVRAVELLFRRHADLLGISDFDLPSARLVEKIVFETFPQIVPLLSLFEENESVTNLYKCSYEPLSKRYMRSGNVQERMAKYVDDEKLEWDFDISPNALNNNDGGGAQNDVKFDFDIDISPNALNHNDGGGAQHNFEFKEPAVADANQNPLPLVAEANPVQNMVEEPPVVHANQNPLPLVAEAKPEAPPIVHANQNPAPHVAEAKPEGPQGVPPIGRNKCLDFGLLVLFVVSGLTYLTVKVFPHNVFNQNTNKPQDTNQQNTTRNNQRTTISWSTLEERRDCITQLMNADGILTVCNEGEYRQCSNGVTRIFTKPIDEFNENIRKCVEMLVNYYETDRDLFGAVVQYKEKINSDKQMRELTQIFKQTLDRVEQSSNRMEQSSKKAEESNQLTIDTLQANITELQTTVKTLVDVSTQQMEVIKEQANKNIELTEKLQMTDEQLQKVSEAPGYLDWMNRIKTSFLREKLENAGVSTADVERLAMSLPSYKERGEPRGDLVQECNTRAQDEYSDKSCGLKSWFGVYEECNNLLPNIHANSFSRQDRCTLFTAAQDKIRQHQEGKEVLWDLTTGIVAYDKDGNCNISEQDIITSINQPNIILTMTKGGKFVHCIVMSREQEEILFNDIILTEHMYTEDTIDRLITNSDVNTKIRLDLVKNREGTKKAPKTAVKGMKRKLYESKQDPGNVQEQIHDSDGNLVTTRYSQVPPPPQSIMLSSDVSPPPPPPSRRRPTPTPSRRRPTPDKAPGKDSTYYASLVDVRGTLLEKQNKVNVALCLFMLDNCCVFSHIDDSTVILADGTIVPTDVFRTSVPINSAQLKRCVPGVLVPYDYYQSFFVVDPRALIQHPGQLRPAYILGAVHVLDNNSIRNIPVDDLLQYSLTDVMVQRKLGQYIPTVLVDTEKNTLYNTEVFFYDVKSSTYDNAYSIKTSYTYGESIDPIYSDIKEHVDQLPENTCLVPVQYIGSLCKTGTITDLGWLGTSIPIAYVRENTEYTTNDVSVLLHNFHSLKVPNPVDIVSEPKLPEMKFEVPYKVVERMLDKLYMKTVFRDDTLLRACICLGEQVIHMNPLTIHGELPEEIPQMFDTAGDVLPPPPGIYKVSPPHAAAAAAYYVSGLKELGYGEQMKIFDNISPEVKRQLGMHKYMEMEGLHPPITYEGFSYEHDCAVIVYKVGVQPSYSEIKTFYTTILAPYADKTGIDFWGIWVPRDSETELRRPRCHGLASYPDDSEMWFNPNNFTKINNKVYILNVDLVGKYRHPLPESIQSFYSGIDNWTDTVNRIITRVNDISSTHHVRTYRASELF